MAAAHPEGPSYEGVLNTGDLLVNNREDLSPQREREGEHVRRQLPYFSASRAPIAPDLATPHYYLR